jgi:hypothetical protein
LCYFSPLPFSTSLNPAGGFCVPRPNIAFSPRVKAAESGLGGVGGGLGSPLVGFSPNTEISFLMISPNLLDICSVFLLVFSPLETADLLNLLILFWPSGDGYSLLCSQKSNFRGTQSVSDLNIPMIDLPILLKENMWSDPGNI